VQLQGASLNGAQLHGASLDQAQLQEASLYWAQLQGASLTGAQIQGSSLFGAWLQGALLYGAELQGASFLGANLQGASLDRAELQGASLDGAQLQGASLQQAKLQGASLEVAQLQDASLQRAELQGASLDSAAIRAADFSGAFLWRTNWGRIDPAKLGAVRLYDAILKPVWQPVDSDPSSGPAPWNAKAYAELRGSMYGVPAGKMRDKALRRIERKTTSAVPGFATLLRPRGDGRHTIDPILSLGCKEIDVDHVFRANKFMRHIRRYDENHASLHREFFALGIHIATPLDDPSDLLVVMMMQPEDCALFCVHFTKVNCTPCNICRCTREEICSTGCASSS
jgi:Pentapeptide repeats (8 copies)